METKELTIIDKVKDVAERSGVPFELDITEVATLAERAKEVTSVDDENFLPIKKEMQQKRKYVTEYMKEARDGFNKQAKAVIIVQNTLLDAFTPEEDRLIALDKAEKERVMKEERLEALPAKRERITTSGIEFTDEEILEMTDADFEIEYNVRLGEKLEADRVADEEKRQAEQAKIDAEKLEIQRQKDEAERVEKARQEEREKAEEALKLAKETAEREKAESEARRVREQKEAEDRRIAEENERIERIEREKAESEARRVREQKEAEDVKAKEIADKAEAEAKRQADEKYQAFLKKNKFNEKTDILEVTEDGATQIYRFVAEFKE
jgi:hypothetical protein